MGRESKAAILMAIFPKVKLKALPTFPASVQAESPILLSRVGGSFTFSLDVTALGLSLAASATIDTTNAANITTGTLPAGRLPALTGDITTAVGTAATTLATVNPNVGTFGSATQSVQFTVNGKGLMTAAANVTITPAIGSITGLGTGVATFLVSPSSANLKSAVTDETGSGALVFGTSPNITTPTGIVKGDVGLGNVANVDTTNAANISSGILPAARLPGPGTSGRLSFVSSTAIKFVPFGGDLIKINGVVFQIPSGGIAGVANTSVFVNGVAGQNLAASTVYYVYSFSNSGTLTADFSTTGHATSSTAGNVGTEIKSGDGTRTLIGMIRTNVSSQFVDSATQRFVRSWFNDPGIVGKTANISATGLGTATNVEISTSLRVEFLTWSGEWVHIGVIGYGYNSVAGNSMVLSSGFDTTAEQVGSSRFDTFTASINASTALSSASDKNDLTEGYHFGTGFYSTSGGAGTANFVVSTQVTAQR
jgi:hypothetical protein